MKNYFLTFLLISTTIPVIGQTDLTPKVVVTTLGTYVGYSNNSGEMVIAAQYKEAHPFYNGLARVKNEEDLYGFINEIGDEVIPFQFNSATDFYRNNGFGEKKPVGLSMVAVTLTEEYQKEPNLGDVLYRGESTTSTRKVDRDGIINTKGKYVVPLDFQGTKTIKGDFASIQFSKDRKQFTALIDEEGNVVFGPLPGNISVAENNIIVTYLNADEINGQSNYLSELYDLEGNRLLGVEKRYGLISESINPKFLHVDRNILQGDKVISKNGLIDLQGNEIIQTLYERIRWESDLNLFRVLIQSFEYDDKDELDVFFYANEKGECVEKENVPCPAPPPAGFDYEDYISKGHKFIKDINETAEIPWHNQVRKTSAKIENESKGIKVDRISPSTGEGLVFNDMNGIWVQSPPPSANGKILKIDKIQKNAICGDYKSFAGNQVFEANLQCIHASDDGYVFYVDYYNRPSWSQDKHYLQIKKIEKKGESIYKWILFYDNHDFSFEINKLLYNKVVNLESLRNKGYNQDWWFWSVYR